MSHTASPLCSHWLTPLIAIFRTKQQCQISFLCNMLFPRHPTYRVPELSQNNAHFVCSLPLQPQKSSSTAHVKISSELWGTLVSLSTPSKQKETPKTVAPSPQSSPKTSKPSRNHNFHPHSCALLSELRFPPFALHLYDALSVSSLSSATLFTHLVLAALPVSSKQNKNCFHSTSLFTVTTTSSQYHPQPCLGRLLVSFTRDAFQLLLFFLSCTEK